MPAKPVQIGTQYFPRKGDALKFFKDMLKRYDIGDRVSAEDAEILKSLVSRHEYADEIVGVGIASFSVRSADHNTKCFWVNRVDETIEKFSYKKCC